MSPASPALSSDVPAAGGALRVYARDAGRRISIFGDGEELLTSVDVELVHVEWFAHEADARAMARNCSDFLAMAKIKADAEGWHAFPTSQIKTLTDVARAHLSLGVWKPPPAPRRGWDRKRVARLGLLVGLGYTAKKIGADPLIGTSAGNVQRNANRFGLALSDGQHGQTSVALPLATLAVYDYAADRAQLTRTAMMRRVLIAMAMDPARLAALG